MPFLKSYALTHVGKSRANNEDFFALNDDFGLYVLADGIGGHSFGEVAAELACKVTLEKFLEAYHLTEEFNEKSALALIKYAIHQANKAVFQKAKNDPMYKNMGTTLCVLCTLKDACIVAHVGDSRIYQYGASFELLTQDHTIFAQSSPKSRSLRGKHFLTKTIGIKEFVEPDIQIFPCSKDDIFLICSDGLSDFLDKSSLEQTLKEGSSLEDMGNLLLEKALTTEARDNITFILVKPQFEESALI
jgi:protein phosphatase